MKALKTLFIATALLGSAAGVQAADNFVGLTWGETSNNIQKSKSLTIHQYSSPEACSVAAARALAWVAVSAPHLRSINVSR